MSLLGGMRTRDATALKRFPDDAEHDCRQQQPGCPRHRFEAGSVSTFLVTRAKCADDEEGRKTELRGVPDPVYVGPKDVKVKAPPEQHRHGCHDDEAAYRNSLNIAFVMRGLNRALLMRCSAPELCSNHRPNRR